MRIAARFTLLALLLASTGALAQAAHPLGGPPEVRIQGDAEPLPIDLHLGRYIYVPGRINGHDVDLVVDTGAAITVVDERFAATIGLESLTTIEAQGVGGTRPAGLARGVSIDIGPLRIRDLTVAIIDFDEVTRRLGRSIPVVIGKELFENAVVDIDYPNARLALHDPGTFRYEGSGSTVRLHRHGTRQLVEVRVEQLPPALFAIDTGSGTTMAIFEHYLKKHDLLEDRLPTSTRPSGGVGGSREFVLATLDSYTFAGYEMKRVPVEFDTDAAGAFATRAFAGNIGAGIFERFRMIFDYSREALHLEPAEDWKERSFLKDRSGLHFVHGDGAVEVIHVAPGSPAARSGWAVGDRVVALDGDPVDAESWATRFRLGLARPAGTVRTFRLEDGEDRRLTLQDYY